jgi:ribonuclease BN (tRNA processing enzyme)
MTDEVMLQILGSGNAFGSGGRFNTCFYVQSPTYRFLIDCGASSIVALQKFGIDFASLDAIFVSHLHGDHFGGIPFVEVACRVEKSRSQPLHIVGPPGIESAVNTARQIFFPEFPTPVLEFTTYKPGVNRISHVEIEAFEAIHSKKTNPHSLRISFNNIVIAFSGDTEWYDGLLALSSGVDIFICECSAVTKAPIHMSYQQLLKHKSEIRAKRIILTHMGDDVLALEECEFERSFDGQKIILRK